MDAFEQQLADKGFTVSRKALIGGKGLYVDTEDKKWLMTGSNLKKLRRFEFGQIIDYELFEDGASVVSGKSGGALLGGILAGAAGAVIGGAGKRSSTEYVNSMQLRVTVNDLKSPSIIFNVPFGFLVTRLERGTPGYRDVSEKVHEMIALLSYMQNNA